MGCCSAETVLPKQKTRHAANKEEYVHYSCPPPRLFYLQECGSHAGQSPPSLQRARRGGVVGRVTQGIWVEYVCACVGVERVTHQKKCSLSLETIKPPPPPSPPPLSPPLQAFSKGTTTPSPLLSTPAPLFSSSFLPPPQPHSLPASTYPPTPHQQRMSAACSHSAGT